MLLFLYRMVYSPAFSKQTKYLRPLYKYYVLMLVITTSEFDIDQNFRVSDISFPICFPTLTQNSKLLAYVNVTDVSTASVHMGEILCLQQKATS